jgi:cellulose synthase/poly-beta-1,6-N-acetylglucosamine synthase-like glycosyltransferase
LLTLALLSASAIFCIWVGYPVLMAACARRRRDRGGIEVDDTRRVSVILATREDAESIRKRVVDLFRTEYPRDLLEVVVGIDHASSGRGSDGLLDLGKEVRVVSGDPPGGKAATLNAAVRAATGDVLVFTDTAQQFAPSAIGRLVGALRDPALGIVSGALRLGSDGRHRSVSEWYWNFERWVRESEARFHSAVGVTGAIYAMPRTLWRELPPGLILDDVYTPMRLVLEGKRVGFRRDAVAIDERSVSPRREYVRKVRTLTGVVQLCAWLPAVLMPGRNPIWLQFLFHKLLRLATPYLLLLFVGGLSVSLYAGLGRDRPGDAAAVVAAFLVVLGVVTLASRRLRDALATAIAMQLAVVRATISGLRGHWDVWAP